MATATLTTLTSTLTSIFDKLDVTPHGGMGCHSTSDVPSLSWCLCFAGAIALIALASFPSVLWQLCPPHKCFFFISSTSSGHGVVAGSMSDTTKMRLQLCLFLCPTVCGRLSNNERWTMLKRPSELSHVHQGVAQAV